jgi:hypothetical protein
MNNKASLFALRSIALLLAAVSLSRTVEAFADEASDAEVLESLRAKWEGQRSSILTAVIEYRCVNRGTQSAPKHDDVLALLSQADLTGNEASLRNVIGVLDATLKGAKSPWSNKVFRTDGVESRDDTTTEGFNSSAVTTGDTEVYKRGLDNQGRVQADVYARGASHRLTTSLTDFKLIPGPKFFEHATLVREKQVSPAGRITVKSGSQEVVVDEQTGFVFEYRQGAPNDRMFHELFQYCPTKYADEVVLPAATFSGTYSFGILNKFSIHLIDRAVINEFVDADVFAIQAKKGDVVVDHRGGQERVMTMEEDVHDILGR